MLQYLTDIGLEKRINDRDCPLCSSGVLIVRDRENNKGWFFTCSVSCGYYISPEDGHEKSGTPALGERFSSSIRPKKNACPDYCVCFPCVKKHASAAGRAFRAQLLECGKAGPLRKMNV